MNRRGFLGLLTAVFVAPKAVVAKVVAPALPIPVAPSIADLLNSEEGRHSLSQTMLQPIRKAIDYQSVGRKLLQVEELPQGAMARYERSKEKPRIKLGPIAKRRFWFIDREQIKSKGTDGEGSPEVHVIGADA